MEVEAVNATQLRERDRIGRIGNCGEQGHFGNLVGWSKEERWFD